MREPYLWRTANMFQRTCVVLKQIQSNVIYFQRMGTKPFKLTKLAIQMLRFYDRHNYQFVTRAQERASIVPVRSRDRYRQ